MDISKYNYTASAATYTIKTPQDPGTAPDVDPASTYPQHYKFTINPISGVATTSIIDMTYFKIPAGQT